MSGHPVRQAHDVINFIQSGKVRLNSEAFICWKGELLTSDDLRNYFGDAGTASDFKKACFDVRRLFQIGDQTYRLHSYMLDFSALNKTVRERYRLSQVHSE